MQSPPPAPPKKKNEDGDKRTVNWMSCSTALCLFNSGHFELWMLFENQRPGRPATTADAVRIRYVGTRTVVPYRPMSAMPARSKHR